MFGVAFRRHRGSLLAAGVGCIIAADLILALAGNVWLVGAGAALWGLHMGATQGLLSALVADAAPADLRGTAFGVFNLVTGVALLAASHRRMALDGIRAGGDLPRERRACHGGAGGPSGKAAYLTPAGLDDALGPGGA